MVVRCPPSVTAARPSVETRYFDPSHEKPNDAAGILTAKEFAGTPPGGMSGAFVKRSPMSGATALSGNAAKTPAGLMNVGLEPPFENPGYVDGVTLKTFAPARSGRKPPAAPE